MLDLISFTRLHITHITYRVKAKEINFKKKYIYNMCACMLACLDMSVFSHFKKKKKKPVREYMYFQPLKKIVLSKKKNTLDLLKFNSNHD